MLSKEEIEKALNNLWCSITDVMFNILYSQEEMREEIEKSKDRMKILLKDECDCTECTKNKRAYKTILQYIQELETEKQKLIETLEKANEEDTEKVKYYEKMRRNTTSEFYKKSYQTNIHKLNAKRETRRSILKIMKGEK